jgi:hypothetical protein
MIFPSTFFKYLNLKAQEPKKSRQKGPFTSMLTAD